MGKMSELLIEQMQKEAIDLTSPCNECGWFPEWHESHIYRAFWKGCSNVDAIYDRKVDDDNEGDPCLKFKLKTDSQYKILCHL